MTAITGSCVCQAVKFSVEDQFLYAGYCHCSLCRKASGAAGTAIGGIQADKFRVLSGQAQIKRFVRSAESVTCFCTNCGSTLFGEKPASGLIHVRYGALDSSPSLRPQAHMHVASKPDWYEITDALPQFSEFPPM